MKVFGIGMQRTGTTSLARALNMLGVRTLQFPTPLFRDLDHPVGREFDGFTDNPIPLLYEELDAKFAFLQNGAGAVPGPFDAYLTMRGLKTLELRMQRHSENAARVADFLSGHPAISQVLYPGLPSHPGHQVAARQMRNFGGMVSVRMAGGVEAARKLCSATEIFILAESLGGVESLIEHPGAMTHASTAGSQLEVPDDLVRLSVGIEDVSDLLADLEQALT